MPNTNRTNRMIINKEQFIVLTTAKQTGSHNNIDNVTPHFTALYPKHPNLSMVRGR